MIDITEYLLAWLLAVRAESDGFDVSDDAIGDTALAMREIIPKVEIMAKLEDFEKIIEAVDTWMESLRSTTQ